MQATKSRRLGAALTAILLTSMGTRLGVGEVMKLANSINSVCDEAAYALALAKTFTGKLDTALEQAAILKKQSTKWRLPAAVEQESVKGAAKTVLSLLMKLRAEETSRSAVAAKETLTKASNVMLARAAALLTARKIQPTGAPSKKSAVAADASNTFASTAAKCTIKADQTVEPQACDLRKINNQEIGEEEEPTTTKLQIKAVSDTCFNLQEMTITAFAGGTAITQGSIGNSHNSGRDCDDNRERGGTRTNGLGADVAFAATRHSTFTSKNIGTVENGKMSCSTAPTAEQVAQPGLDQVKWAICAGLKTTIKKQLELTATKAEELAELDDLRQIAQQILFSRTEIEAISKTQRDRQVREKIKDVYGRGKTDFATNYLKALTTKLNYNLGKQNANEDKKPSLKNQRQKLYLPILKA
uniref:Variant surface glycoprotein 1125.2821 n=1 Tax=Trypanosoma brucei TaxID=5691 RepID=A0A1J0R8W6_9TRYP|nr:variant surface glycoprotein 1125.2821 [Trypanosoma brucei]